MNIQLLLPYAQIIKPSILSEQIQGITTNSHKVTNGSLFIAVKGVTTDGHQFISEAIRRGATALLIENELLVPKNYPGWVLKTTNTRTIVPNLASLFYNNPSIPLFCIGVTGTNGKTSITYLIEHLFNEAHRSTGVIGTINHHLQSQIWPTELTTPNPLEIQERLSQFIAGGAKTLAIEVSSHAIDQKRILGIQFDVGIFTNLTRDHLDYHSTMEEYFSVKNHFFSEILGRSQKKERFAIINHDDSWGRQISPMAGVHYWSYGETNADFQFRILEKGFSGTLFEVTSPYGTLRIQSPLLGIHNIYNVLAAIASALAGGLTISNIESAIPQFKGIPGRLQAVPNTHGKSVLIDYAHTPDALTNVLSSLQALKKSVQLPSKLICIFGCGGDRDKGKRSLMAQAAEKLSDHVIVTSDNPRTEDPLQIINDICNGFSKASESNLFIEPDRGKAIEMGITMAQPNDVVLIAGKGHEEYQIVGKNKFYFSDFETARKLLQ